MQQPFLHIYRFTGFIRRDIITVERKKENTMKLTYKHTLTSCFIGYIVQAIAVNFLPLLFVSLQTQYQLPLSNIALLVSVNFTVQLLIDLTASLYVDKLGYRPCIVAGHLFAAVGFLLLSVLPQVLPPFTGLLIAVTVYGVGSGLIEVLVSPITESCPTENKEKAMSLLHAFYCWGHVGVVLLSTLFFALFGIDRWPVLAALWAIVPVFNAWFLSRVPMGQLLPAGQEGMGVKKLFTSKLFWLLLIMMACGGAVEHAMVQWVSAFAEKGLKITKTLGDLAGPTAIGLVMGIVRTVYGKNSSRLNLDHCILASGVLCVVSLCLITLVQNPVINLIGCVLSGMGIAILWPGILSKSAASLRTGGTAMFALLAVAGDLGCGGGPALVGFVSEAFQDDLRAGILASIGFPVVLIVCLLLTKRKKYKI